MLMARAPETHTKPCPSKRPQVRYHLGAQVRYFGQGQSRGSKNRNKLQKNPPKKSIMFIKSIFFLTFFSINSLHLFLILNFFQILTFYQQT